MDHISPLKVIGSPVVAKLQDPGGRAAEREGREAQDCGHLLTWPQPGRHVEQSPKLRGCKYPKV